MEAPPGIGLNVGSGKIHWPGWISVDCIAGADIRCDIRKLPLPQNYADVICAIHVVEHFYSWELPAILRDWLRVLKPGGRIVLELPSMNKLFGYIARCVDKRAPMSKLFWDAIWGGQESQRPEMCHKYGYTEEMLSEVLEKVGFTQVVVLDARYHFPVRDMRLEGVKPC